MSTRPPAGSCTLRPPGPALGLPAAAGALHQRLRAQVRPRLPGMGWAVWRHPEYVPEELVFRVSYLGGDIPTFALNFSRPGAQVLLQYYNFLRLGRSGYVRVNRACHDVAAFLRNGLDKLGIFEMVGAARTYPCSPGGWRTDTAAGGICTTCPTSCGSRDGWSRRTRCRRTSRTWWSCASSSATACRWTSPTCSSTDIQKAVAFLDRLEASMPHTGRQQTTFHH